MSLVRSEIVSPNHVTSNAKYSNRHMSSGTSRGLRTSIHLTTRLQIYDWMLNIHLEIKLLWFSPWSYT